MGRLFDVCLAAVMAIALAGCASTSSSTEPSFANSTSRPGQSKSGPYPTVSNTHYALPEMPDTSRCVIAPELQHIISVERVGMLKPAQGNLKIEVKIKNLTDSPQHFRYHLEWFDAEGQKLPVEDDGYRTWLLVEREIAYIGATAPTAYAADFGIAFVAGN